MSEYESRGKGFGQSRSSSHDYAPSTARVDYQPPSRSAAEQAHDIITTFVHETTHLRTTVDAVRAAHASNNLEQWTDARSRVDGAFARAERALERARAAAHDASPESRQELEAAERELQEQKSAAQGITEPPTGYATVADEAAILDVFAAPLEGGARIGFDKKQAALEARFDRLTPADRRVLRERLRRNRPNDPIAAAFSRLTEARRRALFEHLTAASKREAQQHVDERREAAVETTTEFDDHSPVASTQTHATIAKPAPIIIAEPEPLDVKLRRILEASESDTTIEMLFAQATADLDGTTRRALAKRLESYRPGGGDEIAARFIRLDRALKQRVCNNLRSGTKALPAAQQLPDEIRGELESATGTSLAHVNVHADAHGNATAAAHGARAVAIGNDIYMGEGQFDATSAEGRELIAHEVAHVVQAQAHPGSTHAAAKRDGDVTDAAEIEADDFAARFRKQGGGISWSPSVAVREGAAMHAPSAASNAEIHISLAQAPEVYLGKHQERLWRLVEDYLQRVNLPEPTPRLRWRDDTAFVRETVEALSRMNLFARRASLLEVLYPADPYTLIAPLLPLDQAWVPTVGSALAQLFEQAIVTSLRRLGPRWVEVAEHKPERDGLNDETKSLVAASSILASAPIDVAVRRGLTVSAVVELLRGGNKDPESQAPRAVKPVTVVWQGFRDRALWNWVYPNREDATEEDVAASLWSDRTRAGWDGPTSYYAYGLVRAGSMFAVPPSWARDFEDARQYAPTQLTEDTGSARFVDLARSKAADELALAGVDKTRNANAQSDAKQLMDTLADSTVLLNFLKRAVGPWTLASEVDIGSRWVAAKEAELATASDSDRTKWAPVIVQQAERLFRIKEGVQQVTSQSKEQDPNSRGADPIRRILTAYARAAAASFIGDVSEQLIHAAASEQSMLALTALRASTNDLSAVVGNGQGVDAKQVKRARELAAESRSLQSQMIAGKTVSAEHVDLTMLQAQELSLHLRIEQIRTQLRQLRKAADAVGQGAMSRIVAQFHSKYRSLDLLGSAFDNHLQMVQGAWDYETSAADGIRDPEEHARVMRQVRRAALIDAQHRFEAIKNDDGLVSFLREGASVVQEHVKVTGWVTICVQLLAMIGLSFVATASGSAVTRMIASWGVRGEALQSAALLARAARTVQKGAAFAAGIGVEATINTAGQAAMQGVPKDGSLFKLWLENAITSGAGTMVLGKISHDLEFAKDIERQTHSMWARVKTGGAVVLAKGVTVSTHVIFNVAVAHVAHKVTAAGSAQPSSSEISEWFMQGVSIALGRYIHGKISERRPLYEKLAELREFAAAKHLLRDADALLHRAMTAETKPTDEQALALLASQRRLIADELAVLDAAVSDPAKRKALQMTEATLRAAQRYARDQIAELNTKELSEFPLHRAGLEELVDGEWKGSRSQVQRAIIAAKRAGIEVAGKPGPDGVWRSLTLGGREIKIHERQHEPMRSSNVDKDVPTTKVSGPRHQVEKQPRGPEESARPAPTSRTHLDTFVKDSATYAEHMASFVGPTHAKAVREVEVRALVADAQVEAGLRVMDPVFGRNASNAFKEAAKTGAEKAISALESARTHAMDAMLATLRDPRLDIASRRRSLVTELDRYEGAVKAHPILDQSAINFAEAKAQARALSENSFADMLTVDETGALARGNKPAGTLHELLKTVKSANAAYRERGVEREFVISITSPSNPNVPREVKVLSRAPKETKGAAPSNVIEPMTDVDGVVVDIGVGLGSFARDAAQEKGPLVQTEYGPKYADAAMTRRDLTWEHTGPRTDPDSVLVLGDALQTLPMMFEARTVKRLFINNINAHYSEGGAEYNQLALGLRRVMAKGGRVEVQWTDDLETTGGKTSSRGHITGPELAKAVDVAARQVPRNVSIERSAAVIDYQYSVEAPRTKSGIPSKTKPTDPVPKFRWVFTFGE